MVLATFAAAASAKQGDGAVTVYQCEHNARLPEDGYADLRVVKSFREDGSVYSMHVDWEDNQGSLVRLSRAGDQAFLSLKWPGEHRIRRDGEPFDWSRGSVNVTFLAADSGNFRNLKGEKWKQVIVARDDSVLVREQDGMKLLSLMGFNLHLVTELEALSSPGRLTMSLDSLLAWGSGVEWLTVYETRVTRRKKDRNTFPDSPVGRSRIVGSYQLQAAALERAAGLIREATQEWEASVAGRWRECPRRTEGGTIILTGGSFPGPEAAR